MIYTILAKSDAGINYELCLHPEAAITAAFIHGYLDVNELISQSGGDVHPHLILRVLLPCNGSDICFIKIYNVHVCIFHMRKE